MDTGTWAILIAAGALLLNFVHKIWGGGWKLSNRLTTLETNSAVMRKQMESGNELSGRVTKIETGVDGIQSEIKKLVGAVGKIADMRGDIRVIDDRLSRAEQDIRELRHGHGFVQNRSPAEPGINREY
jgi:hypothetical protein